MSLFLSKSRIILWNFECLSSQFLKMLHWSYLVFNLWLIFMESILSIVSKYEKIFFPVLIFCYLVILSKIVNSTFLWLFLSNFKILLWNFECFSTQFLKKVHWYFLVCLTIYSSFLGNQFVLIFCFLDILSKKVIFEDLLNL